MKQSAEGMSCCSETSAFLLSDVQQHPFPPVLLSIFLHCGMERRLQWINTDYAGHPSISESRIQSFDVGFRWQGNKVTGAVKVLDFEK